MTSNTATVDTSSSTESPAEPAVDVNSDGDTPDGEGVREWSEENIQNALGIQPQPADRLHAEFDEWTALVAYDADEESAWQDIDGVGPKSEEAIEATVGELDIGGSEPVESADSGRDESGDGGGDDGAGEDSSSADEGDTGYEHLDEFGYETDSSALTGFSAALETKSIVEFLEKLDVVVDEAVVFMTEEGLYARAVCDVNVQMIEATLSKFAFESYSTSGGRIGFDIKRMLDALSLGEKDSVARMEYDAKAGHMQITVDGITRTVATVKPDSIKTLEALPDVPTNVTFECEGEVLHMTIKGADVVMEKDVTVRVDDGCDEDIELVAQDDKDEFRRGLTEENELTDFVSGVDSEAEAKYGKDFIKPIFTRLVDKRTRVTVKFGDSFPAVIKQELLGGPMQYRAMLAPRMG